MTMEELQMPALKDLRGTIGDKTHLQEDNAAKRHVELQEVRIKCVSVKFLYLLI